MRRLVVTLDEECDTLLRRHNNQNQIVRDSIKLYHGDITTGEMVNIRRAFLALTKFLEQKTEYYDQVFSQLEKLISTLETRM